MLGDLVEEELRSQFALQDALAVLMVGSRVDGLDYPGSDVDFLAVYESVEQLPVRVGAPGAARTDSSLGSNWIATMRGEEVNVEAIALPTVRGLSAIAMSPLTECRAAVLQPLEVRLLCRLATGLPLGGCPTGSELVGTEPLRRLPAVVATMNYLGAASHLELARTAMAETDSLGVDLVLAVATSGVGVIALALRDIVVYAPKKVGLALQRLESGGDPALVLSSELRAVLSTRQEPADRLRVADEVMARMRVAVKARAADEGGVWAEAASIIAS